MNACWPMVAARLTATIPMEAITARVTMALSYTIHSNVEVKYEEYIVVCGIKYGISYLWHKLVKFIPKQKLLFRFKKSK